MRLLVLLTFATVGSATAALRPAPPQVGRFPVLEPLGKRTGQCLASATTPALRQEGVWRMVMLTLEGQPDRHVAVGTDAHGDLAVVNAFYSVRGGPRRREAEVVMAFFAHGGALRFGSRSYQTTGTPARLSEDRQSPLTPEDAAAARALGKAVLARCAGYAR